MSQNVCTEYVWIIACKYNNNNMWKNETGLLLFYMIIGVKGILLSHIFSSFALGHLNQSVVCTSLWLFYNPDLISVSCGNSLWTTDMKYSL